MELHFVIINNNLLPYNPEAIDFWILMKKNLKGDTLNQVEVEVLNDLGYTCYVRQSGQFMHDSVVYNCQS